MARKLTMGQQKRRILTTLASSDNLSDACKNANITREQYRVLCADGVISQQELADCKAQYVDRVLAAANRAGLDGVSQPIVRYGKVVTDAQGQPIMQQSTDLSALRFLMERLQQGQDKVKAEKAETYQDNIPDGYRIVFDARELLPTEFAAIKEIVHAADIRRKRRLAYANGHSHTNVQIDESDV